MKLTNDEKILSLFLRGKIQADQTWDTVREVTTLAQAALRIYRPGYWIAYDSYQKGETLQAGASRLNLSMAALQRRKNRAQTWLKKVLIYGF